MELAFIRKALHEEANRRGVEAIITQSVIGDTYNLVVGDGKEGAEYSILFQLTLPSTYSLEEVVEMANKHW